MRRFLGGAFLLFHAHGMGVWGQTDVMVRWVDEAGQPACQLDDAGHTLHISTWMDGVAQHAVQGADLVVDESGISAWKGRTGSTPWKRCPRPGPSLWTARKHVEWTR